MKVFNDATIRKNLKNFEIFSLATSKELTEIEISLYKRTYRKGQILFTAGDPRERIYLLLNGYIKLEKTNESGTMLYGDFIKPYTLFPYGGLFKDLEYHYTAYSLTDVELYYIPTKRFEEILKNNTRQLIHVVEHLSSILRLHESRLQAITNSNASDRVIQVLAFIMQDLGISKNKEIFVECPITTTEIARLSGTSRETVSHVLNQLKRERIVSFENKHIFFHKPDFFIQAGK